MSSTVKINVENRDIWTIATVVKNVQMYHTKHHSIILLNCGFLGEFQALDNTVHFLYEHASLVCKLLKLIRLKYQAAEEFGFNC